MSDIEREAFERYADQYDNYGDEWQDMGVDEHFIAGFRAGQSARAQSDGGEAEAVANALKSLKRYKKAYDEIYTYLGKFLDEHSFESIVSEQDADEAWRSFNMAPGLVFWDRIESALLSAQAQKQEGGND